MRSLGLVVVVVGALVNGVVALAPAASATGTALNGARNVVRSSTTTTSTTALPAESRRAFLSALTTAGSAVAAIPVAAWAAVDDLAMPTAQEQSKMDEVRDTEQRYYSTSRVFLLAE